MEKFMGIYSEDMKKGRFTVKDMQRVGPGDWGLIHEITYLSIYLPLNNMQYCFNLAAGYWNINKNVKECKCVSLFVEAFYKVGKQTFMLSDATHSLLNASKCLNACDE